MGLLEKRTRRRLTMLAVACAALTTMVIPRVAPAAKVKLFVWYETDSACAVFPNYPKPGVKGQSLGWTIPAGDSVIWRYNVNDTWSVVSDPSRAGDHFPWWGFTRRSCIGDSKEQTDYPAGVAVPTRVREGRSRVAESGWRAVDYDHGPETIVGHGVRVKKNATLRDRANFFVGNVFAGWKVDVTNLTRSSGHWVYVYSPSARKWGYIEAGKLETP